jgi:hypothetical protein
MSGSGSGSGPGTPEAVVVEQTLASSTVNEPSPQNSPFSAGNDGSAAAAEKTISCISCRGRKLKCDRVKPRCGTCTRLRHHNCEYPERRRNVGTRRRNMRDLEARLGASRPSKFPLVDLSADILKPRLKQNSCQKARSRTARTKYHGYKMRRPTGIISRWI